MIRYEFRKLFQQKIGLILIITCIVIASLLFTVSDQIKEDGSLRNNAVIIQEYENIISDMSFEEAIVWLEQEYDTQSERFQKEYRESGDKSRMLITGSLVNLIDKYKYLASYDDYIKSVLNQAKQMQKVALFRDSRYVEENTERTVKDFSPLLSVEVSRDAPMFIAASTSYKIGDYILFISIIILVILIFGYEEGSDGKTLLWVQYKGKLPVFFAKLITTAISVTVLIAVYYGVILLIGHYLYREIDQGVNFSAMIQSLPEFRSCTYIISVAEYLLLFFALNIINGLLIMMIIVAAVCFAGNSGGIILSIGMFGIWYSAYRWIGVESILSPLKYLNPIAWFDVYQWVSTYRNINFFTYALPFSWGFYCGIILCTLLTFIIAVKMYFRNKAWKAPEYIISIIHRFHSLSEKAAESTSLMYQEAYRLFVANKHWCIILSIPMIFTFSNIFINKSKIENFNMIAYEYYIHAIDSEYSEDTEVS